MDPKHLTAVIVSAILGVILLATVVAPIVADGQTTTGDPIVKNNNTNVLLRPVEVGDVLAPSFDGTKWVWSLNDEVISGVGNNPITWDSYVISDSMYLSGRAAGDNWAATISIFSLNPTTWSGYCNKTDTTASITFGDGVITVTGTNSGIYETSTTVDYTWAYVVCPEVEATYCAAVSGGVGYVKSSNDLILCGTYSTGENDCAYTYKNGVANVIGGDYTINVNQELTTTSGTTDIYSDTVSVDIGEENFTPFRIFVPYEIEGHATSGSLYSMLGVIPIVVAIGIVLGVVSMAIVNRYD